MSKRIDLSQFDDDFRTEQPEERGDFEDAVPETTSGFSPGNPTSAQTYYHVDLRELELKAAKAQATAERAQRDLLEARLREKTESQR